MMTVGPGFYFWLLFLGGTPAVTNHILTEASGVLLTEAGDSLTTE